MKCENCLQLHRLIAFEEENKELKVKLKAVVDDGLCGVCGGKGYTQEVCAGGGKISHACPACKGEAPAPEDGYPEPDIVPCFKCGCQMYQECHEPAGNLCSDCKPQNTINI